MAAFLSRVRGRGPQLWGPRLVLGVSLLGLLLAGFWQGEFHSHESASTAHTLAHDHDTTGADPQSGSSDPHSLHFHDAACSVAMLGPTGPGDEWPDMPVTWVPDYPVVRAPPISLNTPHRPPIA